MKPFAIASSVVFAITSIAAQLTAPTQNYNVISPVPNGPYVMGQILPCTIQLFENVMSDIRLSISLDSAAPNSNAILIIAQSFDVSKTTASAKKNGNVTYYEQSVNYNIPITLIPGAYKVVFLDSLTNTHLDVPINVLPVASVVSSPVPTGSASAVTPSSHGSVVRGNGNSFAAMSLSLTTKAIVYLVCIAVMTVVL